MRTGNNNAFTLIELILAITLMAAITVAAYLSLSNATRCWRVGVDTADARNHADYIMQQIVAAISSAYYPSDENKVQPDYGMQLENNGDDSSASDSLTWVKLGTALVGNDSRIATTPHKVSLSVVGEGESDNPDLASGGLVIRSWSMDCLPEDFDPDDEEYVKPVLLMPDVIGIDFQVYSPKDNLEEGKLPGVDKDSELEIDKEEKWIDDDWTGDYTNRLPYYVKASIFLKPLDDHSDPIKISRIAPLRTAPLSWPDKFGYDSDSKANKKPSKQPKRP